MVIIFFFLHPLNVWILVHHIYFYPLIHWNELSVCTDPKIEWMVCKASCLQLQFKRFKIKIYAIVGLMERDAKSFKFNGKLISILFEFNLMRKAMHIILHGLKDLLKKNNAFILCLKCSNRQFITLLTLNILRQIVEPLKINSIN